MRGTETQQLWLNTNYEKGIYRKTTNKQNFNPLCGVLPGQSLGRSVVNKQFYVQLVFSEDNYGRRVMILQPRTCQTQILTYRMLLQFLDAWFYCLVSCEIDRGKGEKWIYNLLYIQSLFYCYGLLDPFCPYTIL